MSVGAELRGGGGMLRKALKKAVFPPFYSVGKFPLSLGVTDITRITDIPKKAIFSRILRSLVLFYSCPLLFGLMPIFAYFRQSWHGLTWLPFLFFSVIKTVINRIF